METEEQKPVFRPLHHHRIPMPPLLSLWYTPLTVSILQQALGRWGWLCHQGLSAAAGIR